MSPVCCSPSLPGILSPGNERLPGKNEQESRVRAAVATMLAGASGSCRLQLPLRGCAASSRVAGTNFNTTPPPLPHPPSPNPYGDSGHPLARSGGGEGVRHPQQHDAQGDSPAGGQFLFFCTITMSPHFVQLQVRRAPV